VAACIIDPQMKRSLGRLADRIAGEIDGQAADAITIRSVHADHHAHARSVN
jgi:hypothetical protein